MRALWTWIVCVCLRVCCFNPCLRRCCFNSCLRPCKCAWVCVCLPPVACDPELHPFSSSSPITLNLWEKIHPQGLWNERGSLRPDHLISLCCFPIFTSYFRCPLVFVGSWDGLQRPLPARSLYATANLRLNAFD